MFWSRRTPREQIDRVLSELERWWNSDLTPCDPVITQAISEARRGDISDARLRELLPILRREARARVADAMRHS